MEIPLLSKSFASSGAPLYSTSIFSNLAMAALWRETSSLNRRERSARTDAFRPRGSAEFEVDSIGASCEIEEAERNKIKGMSSVLKTAVEVKVLPKCLRVLTLTHLEDECVNDACEREEEA